MTVIAASVQTLTPGVAGAWFDVTGDSFVADVDSQHSVRLETRRGAGDSAPKVVAVSASGNAVQPSITGPCSVLVSCVAGRQYRFFPLNGAAVVAADQ